MDETFRPTIHTQADLEEVWRHLRDPWGFGRRSIWMLRIARDRRAVPTITEITGCDGLPEPEMADGLSRTLHSLDRDDPGGTFAFLLSRPGRGVDGADRAWARFLIGAGEAAGVRLEMVHLADDAGVVPLPPDDLAQRRSA